MSRFGKALRLTSYLTMFRLMLRTVASSKIPTSAFRRNIPAFASTSSILKSARCPRMQSFQQQLTPSVRYFSATSADTSAGDAVTDFFAPPEETFESMGIQSPVLLSRIEKNLNLTRPSAVQVAAFSAIAEGGDITIGAETGSGKTFAYLWPIIDDILQRKQKNEFVGYDYARAIILVPNKELVNQVVRMAVELCGGQDKALVYGSKSVPQDKQESNTNKQAIVRIAVIPGGLNAPQDFPPFRHSIGLGGKDPPVDLVISTPAAIGPLGLKPKNIDMFADIQTLVIDEADMLLDGGYIRQLENVLLGFRRADRLDSSLGVRKTQHVFVAATLPDMGLRSVDPYLKKKFPNATDVTMAGMHNARHYGLSDSTLWIEEDGGGNKERMQRLVEMLEIPKEEGGLQGEKIMVFLNSVDDVDGVSGALSRAGIDNVPYHAKIKLQERAENLDKFRRYSFGSENRDAAGVLVCTDLASRGLDVPGVTAVVQLQFSGNVVAHLHRMGRCGRAGNRNGRGIVFYGPKERELVEVVQAAESQQERMVLQGDVDEIEEEIDSEETVPRGSVKNAFSRKRGFTKKRKKLRREADNV
jgi:superfamily II DNA/RNA helicase